MKMKNLKANLLTVALFVVAVGWGTPCPALMPSSPQDNTKQDELNPADEKWFGVLDLQVAKLRLELRLRKQPDGSWSGGMVSLDQSTTEIPFDSLTYNDQRLSWNINSLQASFEGQLDAAGQIASGSFKQGPTQAKLEFKRVAAVPPRKHVQTWQGNLVAGPRTFDFQFRAYEDADGSSTWLLDSFTENIGDLNCTAAFDGDQVTIEVPISAGKLVGTLNKAGDTIDGQWLQNGNELPITLKSIPLAATRKLGATYNRPQTPQPPFPYGAEDLEIENQPGGSVLAGTLTTPSGKGPFPVVITISGSGPQDRDETIMGHKPFLVIADHLTRHGIAVFRFDDRGIGKSKGDRSKATSEDYAGDVAAIVARLKTHPKIDPEKILLAGHSEGGIIAPLVADENRDVAGIILLAGTGVSGKEISLNQSRKISAGAGMAPFIVEVQEKILTRMYARLEQGQAIDDEFVKALTAEMKELIADEIQGGNLVETIVTTAKGQLSLPWFQFFALHDPAPVLEKIQCPVLVIIGNKDTQVDPDLNLPPIKAALDKAGNDDVEIKRMPNLNHLFQECETGLPTEYATIEQTISPQVLELMVDWISQRFK